ncbi:MAG: type II toxin-antitoxin system VapB family antitoxin [Planctomycetales bacterium]
MIAVRLPAEVEERIAKLAARTGRTKTFYIKEAILEHLDEMEDKYLALDRLERPARRWTLDEMEQGLDMES